MSELGACHKLEGLAQLWGKSTCQENWVLVYHKLRELDCLFAWAKQVLEECQRAAYKHLCRAWCYRSFGVGLVSQDQLVHHRSTQACRALEGCCIQPFSVALLWLREQGCHSWGLEAVMVELHTPVHNNKVVKISYAGKKVIQELSSKFSLSRAHFLFWSSHDEYTTNAFKKRLSRSMNL